MAKPFAPSADTLEKADSLEILADPVEAVLDRPVGAHGLGQSAPAGGGRS